MLEYEILRKLSKIFKKFLRKIAKMHYFNIVSKNLTYHALIFCGFDEKRKMLGTCGKILKSFLKQNAKMHYLTRFFKEFNKSCIKFSRLAEKRK